MDKVKAIFMPFAGGSKYSFQKFLPHVDKLVFDIIPMELPGRGARFKEVLLDEICHMVDDVFQQSKKYYSEAYCLYGHSMGSIISFLLARKILKEGHPPPLSLFFSGASAPCTMIEQTSRHKFSKDQLSNLLKDMGGVPSDILIDDSLFKIFEPVIRADFKAMDNYLYTQYDPMPVPLTIMIGENENISDEQAVAWKQETSETFRLYKFPGNHFFIYDNHIQILEVIDHQLKQTLNIILN